MTIVIGPNQGAGGASPQPVTAQELAASAANQIATATAALNDALAQPESSDPSHLAQLTIVNSKVQDAMKEIEQKIAVATQEGVDTTDLRTSLRGLQQLSATFSASFNAQIASYLSTPATGTTSSSGPVLQMPLPNQATFLTPNDQMNLFLLPALSTTIFLIMQQVQKQKLINKDAYRELQTELVKNMWEAAKNAANMTLLSGLAQASVMQAQAIGSLVSGCLSIGAGIASLANTGRINKSVDKRVQDQRDALGLAPDQAGGPSSWETESVRASRLQNDKISILINTAKDALPQFSNGISGMVAAGSQVEKAHYEAATAVYNAMAQSMNTLLQQIQQAFNEQGTESDAINSFLQQFSQALTRMVRA